LAAANNAAARSLTVGMCIPYQSIATVRTHIVEHAKLVVFVPGHENGLLDRFEFLGEIATRRRYTLDSSNIQPSAAKNCLYFALEEFR